MTIQEAQALILELEKNITAQLQQFQTATGLRIHSVPVAENDGSGTPAVTAKVKVLL